MNKIITLIKVLLKNDNMFSISDGSNKKSSAKTGVFWIIIAFAFFPMILALSELTSSLYTPFAAAGRPDMVIGLILSIVSIMIFIFSIFYIMNVFYFSSDVTIFLSMPVRPYQIIVAKFSIVLMYEYLAEALFLLPEMITYGIKSNGNFVFIIYSVIVFLLLPIIPVVFASVIDILVMRLIGKKKSKDSVKRITSLISLIIAFGFSFLCNSMQKAELTKTQVNDLISSSGVFNKLYITLFMPNQFASNALSNTRDAGGLFYMVFFILLTAVFFMLLLLISHTFYLKSLYGITDVSEKVKAITKNEFSRVFRQKSSVMSYTFKELKLLVRSPVYFINCVVMTFIWPLIFIIPLLTDKNSLSSLGEIKDVFQNPHLAGILFTAFVAIDIFIASANCIASTSISREGAGIYVSKYLPVSYRKQLTAKALSGFTIGFIGSLLIDVIIFIMFKIPAYILLLSLLTGMLGILFTCLLGILIDLNFPKLKWTNEQKAVKQNMNPLICMLVSIAAAGFMIYLIIKFNPSLLISFMIITAALLLVDFLLFGLISKVCTSIYSKINPPD